MADILTQLADYYAGRKPAQAKVIPTAEGKVLDASQEQPTVFKGMMLPGADIVLEAPKPKAPEPEPIQDMPTSVIEAEPFSRAEPSSQVLARTKFDFGNIFDQLKAMEPKQTATESIESVKTRMQQPKAKVDLNAVMSDLNEAKTAQPDWTQEDYIKGALFTILPALVGNAMYGVSGAYAGAAGGQKGFDAYMTQRQKEAEEKAKSAKSKAELRLKAYEAEQKYDLQDLDRALKLADLELRRDGKVSDVTNNRLNTLVNAVRGIETDVFKTDQAREGARDLQIMRDASAEDRARLGAESGLEKAKTLAQLKAEAAEADRAFKAEQARLNREAALAKQRLANAGKATSAASAKTKEPTADAKKSAGFANMMENASALADKYYKTPDFDATDWQNPLISKLGPWESFLQTPDGQNYINSVASFINAKLRNDSGAAISPQEFEKEAKENFPQPGDSKEVIAQKRIIRQNAIARMRASGGEVARGRISESGGTVQRLDPFIEKMAKSLEPPVTYGEARAIMIQRGYRPKDELPTVGGQ